MPRHRSAKAETAPEWTRCSTCNQQMVGGPRCFTHNPTPEQRERLSIPVAKFSVEADDEEDDDDA